MKVFLYMYKHLWNKNKHIVRLQESQHLGTGTKLGQSKTLYFEVWLATKTVDSIHKDETFLSWRQLRTTIKTLKTF